MLSALALFMALVVSARSLKYSANLLFVSGCNKYRRGRFNGFDQCIALAEECEAINVAKRLRQRRDEIAGHEAHNPVPGP